MLVIEKKGGAGGGDHGGLTGLGDDDHSIYALLAGRSGGQALIGGSDASDDLTLQSTSNGTRGSILFGSAGNAFYDEVSDILTLTNSGLHLLDTNASHDLIIVPGSDLTADKTLTLTTGNFDRTITLSGNPTLNDWFDQGVKSGTSPTFDSANFTGVGGQFALARISGSTFSTLQHLQDVFHSAGWVSGGGITDDTDGTITVAAGTGLIRANDTATSEILFTDWAAESGANVNLADNDVNYVYVEYTGGSPAVFARTTESTDFNTKILLAVIQRSGTTLHINAEGKHIVGDHANSMIRRLKETMKFARVSGAVISATGTRNWAITTGDFWEGLGEFTLAAFDSSGADSFSYWYRQAADSGWNEVVTQSPIHQTNYDDNSGSLATLSNNKYGVHWCYIEIDDHAHVVYGQGNYTLAQAEDAGPPAGVPEPIEANGILVGKIIIKENDAAFTQIESAFGGQFTPSVAVDHGALVGLADDDHTQYLLADGTRALAGVWDMGSQALTNVNIDSGVITGITDLLVADGGSGRGSATAYAVLCGGTTSTAALQSIAGVGTSGQVLTSNGASALPTFQAAAGGGGDFTWVEKTGAYTAVAGDGIMVGSDTGAITITLPASASLGDTIAITDQDGNAATNNITTARNGLVIMGLSEDMIINENNQSVILVYSADAAKGWRIR